MSNDKNTAKVRGSATTPKGYNTPERCKRFKTANVPSAATLTAGFRGNPRWVKKQIELTKTVRMMTLGAPYAKLPKNITGAIRWFSSPFPLEWGRRATRGTETGEAVPVSAPAK